jgi:hypothetical protein
MKTFSCWLAERIGRSPSAQCRIFARPFTPALELWPGSGLLAVLGGCAGGRIEAGRGGAPDPLVVARSARGLSSPGYGFQSLAVLEAGPGDVQSEDADTAQLARGRIVSILDGHLALRRHGRGLPLAGADLRGARLRGAALAGADLTDANLCGADLERADLEGADLSGADLQGCNLYRTNLRGARLHHADLRRASLRHAELRESSLAGCALRGADLWAANVWQVDWSRAYLDGVDLSRADTRGS